MDTQLYAVSSIAIAVGLLIAILAANELGYRGGRWWQKNTDEEIKGQTVAITASVLGLLALLLGFTYNMSVQRYDSRAAAMLDEANAIGTAFLRISLIPDQYQQQARQLFAVYAQERVASGQLTIVDETDRQTMLKREADTLEAIWRLAIAAADTDPRPVTAGLFIQSLNDMIDARDKRHAVLERSVPPIVFYLLFTVVVLSCGFLGYGSGLSGRRANIATLLLTSIIVAVMFILIDLDRPRRGYIQVNQAPMLQLLDTIAPRTDILSGSGPN